LLYHKIGEDFTTESRHEGRAGIAAKARVGPVTYPDGLAYAAGAGRIFVSDEHGKADAVIDARRNALVTHPWP